MPKLSKWKWTAKAAVIIAIIWGGLSLQNISRAQTPPANPVNLSPDLQEIVTLSRQHMDDSVITNYIISTGKSYKLGADDIIYLNSLGVSQGVISALLRSSASPASPAPTAATAPTTPATPTTAPPAPATSAASTSAPVPPPLDGEAPPPAPAPLATSTVSTMVPMPTTPAPAPIPVPAGLQDNFYTDTGLNPGLWLNQSAIVSSLGSLTGIPVQTVLSFSPSGMQMQGTSGPGQFMGIQSAASFVPPFTFSATVSGLAQSAIPFEVYLVSSDLQQWVSVAGHLGGRAVERSGVRVGIGGLFHYTTVHPVNAADYGFWINHTGSGLPISALGFKLADNPIAGIPYTIQISAGADGAASVALLDSASQVLAAQSVPAGMGPFYVVLAGRNGPTYADWQSVQLTPATPVVAAPPVAVPQPVAVAPPAVPATPTLDYFQSQLAPYGNWVNVPGYGLGWEPAVDPGWRPYYDGGHWEYTDAGWYWQSDYPWGDITFHYGRWVYASLAADPAWVWVPGFDYAPAWVVWRHADDDGYIGWAPLPPGAVFVDGGWEYNHVRVGADFAFGLGDGFFTFVDYDHLFFDPHLYPHGYRHFIVPHDRLALIYRHSVIESHYQFDHGRFINAGMPHDRMVVLTHHDIHPMVVADLRHQEEIHNAIERRDDIHDFHPGVRPEAIRPMAQHPEENHPGFQPGHSQPPPQSSQGNHGSSSGKGQNYPDQGHDHGNQPGH